jgi:hypothetical protein
VEVICIKLRVNCEGSLPPHVIQAFDFVGRKRAVVDADVVNRPYSVISIATAADFYRLGAVAHRAAKAGVRTHHCAVNMAQ